MSLSDELRRVDELMVGWEYQGLLSSAADTIDAQAATLREVMSDRDREIARLRRELTTVTEAWHELRRNSISRDAEELT